MTNIQHVSAERVLAGEKRLDEAVRLAAISGEHVWVAVMAHLVRNPSAGGPILADAESLVSAHTGCYVCEEPYTERLLTRRCKGEPS